MKLWFAALLHCLSSARSMQFADGFAKHPSNTSIFFTKVDKVPVAWKLAQIFRSKLEADEGENLKPLPESVQLVLGVMSTQSTELGVLEVHRRTWMKRSGVCRAAYGPQPGCTVYVAFVFGDGKLDGRANSSDELFLNGTENMNEGKTFAFFHYASRAYNWSTHIGKMDLDTFPHLHNLTTSLERHLERERNENCGAYFGMPMDFTHCGEVPDLCPPKDCGFPVNGNFMDYQTGNPNCWVYMQGGLYVLSTSLARGATNNKGVWSHNRVGPEDLKTGWVLSQYAKRHLVCVDTWDSVLAFDHLPSQQRHPDTGKPRPHRQYPKKMH